MGRFDHLGEVLTIAPEIQEATPERCKPCYRAEITAQHIAHRVVSGEITLEEAKQEQMVAFEECRYGAAANEIDGSPDCRYAVMCEFNPRPAYGSPEAQKLQDGWFRNINP